jgi:hypothetical protein
VRPINKGGNMKSRYDEYGEYIADGHTVNNSFNDFEMNQIINTGSISATKLG